MNPTTFVHDGDDTIVRCSGNASLQGEGRGEGGGREGGRERYMVQSAHAVVDASLSLPPSLPPSKTIIHPHLNVRHDLQSLSDALQVFARAVRNLHLAKLALLAVEDVANGDAWQRYHSGDKRSVILRLGGGGGEAKVSELFTWHVCV